MRVSGFLLKTVGVSPQAVYFDGLSRVETNVEDRERVEYHGSLLM